MKNNDTHLTRSSNVRRALPRSRSFYLLALGLALVAPLGLPLAESLIAGELPTLAGVLRDIKEYPVTYLYLSVLTAGTALAAGLMLGRELARARLLAITDPLTGLYNRRHFSKRLAEEIERGRRYRHPTSVLVLDVDRLKSLNDRHGHGMGDQALAEVSRCLSRSLRSTDVVARVGGDEFAAVLPETASHEARALARRITDGVKQLAATAPLSVSIGVAAVEPTDPADPAGVLADADRALYQAKAAGGGRVEVSRRAPARAPRAPAMWRYHSPRAFVTGGSGA